MVDAPPKSMDHHFGVVICAVAQLCPIVPAHGPQATVTLGFKTADQIAQKMGIPLLGL